MRSLLILAFIAIGFAGAVVSRQIGLLVYVWFSLFRPLEWIWVDLTSLRLSLVAGLLLLVPCVLTLKLPNVTHPLSLLAWAFLGTVVGAEATTFVDTDWGWVDQFVRLLLVSSLAVTLVKTRDHLSQLVAVTAGSFAFFSAKAGVSALMGDGVQFGSGQAGAFVDNNGYALAVNMAMPMMAAAAATFQAPVPGLAYWRKGFLAAIPLSVITIIFTMSRAGLLALGTLAVVASLLQRRPMLWLAGLTLSGALLFAVVPMPDGYVERMQTITTYEQVGEGSALGRLHFWRIAWLMAKDNPWGVGLRRYDNAYDNYDDSNGAYGRSQSVHNSHLEVLAEMGFLGIALWTFTFLYALWVCMRIRYSATSLPGLSDEDRRYYLAMSTAFAASMTAFIVGGAFIAAANNELTWLTFAMIAALDRIYRAHVRSLQAQAIQVDRAAPVIPQTTAQSHRVTAPRVLQVVLRLDPGGTERLVIELVRRLHARVPMGVCCLDAPGAWAERVTALGVPVVTLSRPPGFHPRLAWRLAGAARAIGANVLHCHHYSPFVYGCVASWLAPGLRPIYTEHGRLSDAPPSLKRTLANRLIMTGAPDLYAVSHDLRAHLLREAVPARMRVIWNGIDPGEAPAPAARQAARARLGVGDDAIVVGAVARLDPVKDLRTLVDAVAVAATSQPRLQLAVVGDGPERERLEDAIRRGGAGAHVRLLGHRDDVRTLLPGFDVFANSSTSEGISLTLLEAMAAELPIVATRVGGTPEVVVDRDTGRLVPARDAGAMAAALLETCADPARGRAWGVAGRRRLLDHFTIDEMVRRYEAVYQEVASR